MIPAGTTIDVVVSYLEMTENPGRSEAEFPAGHALIRAEDPPVWYFLGLYYAVGRDYEWQDRFEQREDEVAAYVADPCVELWTLQAMGWPQGFFQLDFRQDGICDLAYFGLVPEAVGAGIGTSMLQTAIAKGWARGGVNKVTVNTCTLDHPRALGLYRKMGFRPVNTGTYRRVLRRDRVEPLAESA